MNIVFSPVAWNQYTDWQQLDKSVIRKINELVKDICRNGASNGIGKPEPLKYRKAWSRRISYEHRLVYNIDDKDNLLIIACKGHYID